MLQVAVKELPRRPRRPGELLQAHAAEVLAVDVKLLERNAAGVQLVGVQEVLEPLPHLILGPVLRMDFMPLASKKPTGNCKRGGSPVSDLCLSLSMIPDAEVHHGKSQGLQPRCACISRGWMGSGEEALGNAIPSQVLVGANHSASPHLPVVPCILTPGLWIRTQDLKPSEIMSFFPIFHKVPQKLMHCYSFSNLLALCPHPHISHGFFSLSLSHTPIHTHTPPIQTIFNQKPETRVLFFMMPLFLPRVVQMIHLFAILMSPCLVLVITATVTSLPYPVTVSNFPLSTEVRSKTSKSDTEALHYS